ncbi:MAG: ABC transporter ATP-binding protein [Oscillibacter sp.]|jgi:osmoprotectant transport system ATP-binding protein|nr:ABC transporter ATP-binding protein [Oscillibacter sp.]
MIQFEHVSKSYGRSEILHDLSFTVPDGRFLVLIGPSGCGKTTTMKMINRLLDPDSGRILLDGQDVSAMNPVELRRRIGYVIQQIGLFPNMTIEQNICVVPRLLKYEKSKCGEIARELLELVGLPYDQYARKYPNELSGGQQQRIGVLRALAASPPVVLMDEPFGALDPMTRETLQDEVKKLQKKLRKTIVFVTHDMSEALRLADIILFMNGGRIEQMAPPEQMLEQPASDLVRSFLGKHKLAESAPIRAEDFMRKNPYRVSMDRGVLECAELMARSGVDTLLVTDEDDRYLGVLPIRNIRLYGRSVDSIVPLITKEMHTVRTGDDARGAMEYLMSSGDSYVVVLNGDDTVAGIITKNSMARVVADTLWGEAQQP